MRSKLFKLVLMLVCAATLAFQPSAARAGDCGDCGGLPDGTLFRWNWSGCSWWEIGCNWYANQDDCNICGWERLQ